MRPFTGALLTMLVTAGALPALAQSPAAGSESTPVSAEGWSFTPSMLYGGLWDDNPLVKGKGDDVVGDSEQLINPRGGLLYRGRRNQFSADYSGAFLVYHQFNALNSYDQHAASSVSRRLTQHATVSAGGSLALSPTTELLDVPGVPFVRDGSRVADAHGGLDLKLSKRLSVSATGGANWITFQQSAAGAFELRGGRSTGGTLAARETIDTHTTLTADYDLHFATVGGASGIGSETFVIQNAWAGAERTVTQSVRLFAAAGASRMGATDDIAGRTGPAWRAGISDEMRRVGLEVSFVRSYVPTFSFGGTAQNEDLTARLRLSLAQRLYTAATMSWESNEPLVEGDPSLKSLWIDVSAGYELRSWMRLEAFFNNAHQDIDRPGGVLDRRQFGLQVVTSKPMRIR